MPCVELTDGEFDVEGNLDDVLTAATDPGASDRQADGCDGLRCMHPMFDRDFACFPR